MTPSEFKQLEANLWQSADTLRANSDLTSNEYSTPVLGLIFSKFADNKYRQYEAEIQQTYEAMKGTRREQSIAEIAIEKCGFYLPDHARYDYLLTLPEQEDIAAAIKLAMVAIETHKPELKGVLPQDEYFRLVRGDDKGIPKRLLKNFSNIPADATGDMFGQIYQYFLGNFASAEGQGGGEFFTPDTVVRLMVEIIEPRQGTVFDPACGSGGMFVQSARFVEAQQLNHADLQTTMDDLFVCGQEKQLETVKLAEYCSQRVAGRCAAGKHLLRRSVWQRRTVRLCARQSTVQCNKSKPTKQQGNESVPNANYLWINLFATSLKPNGRAALVMANSASDARHSEAEIRQRLIEQNLIYGMLTLPSNMFYTVTLPATLWFFDRHKPDEKILFIDARNIFMQVDRAHRQFSPEQVSNLALIS